MLSPGGNECTSYDEWYPLNKHFGRTSFKEPYHVQQAIVNSIFIMVCFSIHYII